MLAGIPDSRCSPAAFQSVLRAGPVYLLRATHQHVLLNALEDLLPLSCCFAGPTVLAFVPLPGAAEHLVEWVNDFQAEDGALLQLSLTGEGSLWPATGNGGRRDPTNIVADTLKAVGLPALWGTPHYAAFFDLLGSQGLFLGGYSILRPQRPDGSLMDLTKIVCGLPSTIVLLTDLSSIKIEQTDLSAVEIRFERISDRFEWRLPDDTDWTLIAEGMYDPPTVKPGGREAFNAEPLTAGSADKSHRRHMERRPFDGS